MTTMNERRLDDDWILWYHLPHPFETDWSMNGYKKIDDINTVEKTVGIVQILPNQLVQTCMLYLMRSNVKPLWEDAHNRKGGCFSYQIPNNSVVPVWTKMTYALVGNTLTSNEQCMKSINGISVSPKKKFCIIKIWLSDCRFQDPNIITKSIDGLTSTGCLFKKHTPEY